MNADDAAVFVLAAQLGSLSAAARRLDIAAMTASRRLAALEKGLGVRLLNRSTRSVSLTPAGSSFLPFAEAMVEARDAGLASIGLGSSDVTGLLRISAPASFGQRIVEPVVSKMLDDYPGLRIDLDLSDSVIDIVSSGIDVAIRAGELQSSTLIARKLAPKPRVLCAAPSYLQRRGIPRDVGDLSDHDCLPLSGADRWRFNVNGQKRDVKVAGRFSSNSMSALRSLCLAGHGLALLSEWDIDRELQNGSLVTVVLENGSTSDQTIWAVYPTSRMLPRKVTVFVETLTSALVDRPWRS